jgi:hypothetical protein
MANLGFGVAVGKTALREGFVSKIGLIDILKNLRRRLISKKDVLVRMLIMKSSRLAMASDFKLCVR